MTLVLDTVIGFANVSTILLSAFTKIPQIRSVWKARSGAGLSTASVMMELTGYCITLSYFVARGFALSGYLEYPLLVVQDVFLLTLVAWLGGGGLMLVGYGGVLLALAYAMVGGLMSETTMVIVASSSTPISAFSKVVQIMAIIRKGSSKGISLTSWLISAYTCASRLFTVYIVSTDVPLLANFAIALFLNIILVLVTLYYTPSPPHKKTKKHSKQEQTSESRKKATLKTREEETPKSRQETTSKSRQETTSKSRQEATSKSRREVTSKSRTEVVSKSRQETNLSKSGPRTRSRKQSQKLVANGTAVRIGKQK